MITKAQLTSKEVLINAIFEILTTAASAEVEPFGSGDLIYYLHGDEETGDLFENGDDLDHQNLLFTARYDASEDDPDDSSWSWENRDNSRFMDTVEDLADQWLEKYGV